MIFYAIRINSQPQISFAASLTMELPRNRHNIIDHRESMLEFSFCTERRSILADGRDFDIPPREILTVTPASCYTLRIPGDETRDTVSFTLTSAAFRCPQMQVSVFDTDPPGAMPEPALWEDPDVFFLPMISSLTETEFRQSDALITAIIDSYAAGHSSSRWLCLSDFYELIALLDASFRHAVRAEEQEPYRTGTRYYIRKAQKYIEAHFREPLTLSRIAAQLGISSGYLCELFRHGTGRTVTDTVRFLRMQELRRRISACPERPLRELCTEVGFRDVRYVQRLFRRFYGISMQQCRKIDRGVSLYHENPWEKSDLDHDIFYDPPGTDAPDEP